MRRLLIGLLMLCPFLSGAGLVGTAVSNAPAGASCCSTAPTVRAAGAVSFVVTGTVAPALPTGTSAGDLLLMFVKTSEETVTVSGWTEAPDSPVSVGGAGCPAVGCDRITVFYKIAAGGDATTTSSQTDQTFAFILGITTGTFDSGSPFHVTSQNTQASTASVSITGDTTTDTNLLVVQAVTGDLPDANGAANCVSPGGGAGEWANADLGTFTEQADFSRTSGVGGMICAVTSPKAASGSFGATTVTASTAAVRANWSAAVQGL